MMKFYSIAILLLFLVFSSNADLITITVSADASNNSSGQFIEYIFSFDIEQSGYYTVDGSLPYIYYDIDGYDLFYARFDGLFNVPVSDLVPQSAINCGLIELSSSLSILLMSANGNSLSVSGNLISDWQIGDTLDGLERGYYANGSVKSIASNLIITDIAYNSFMVSEPPTLYMFFTGSGLLYCIFLTKRKKWLKKTGG
ncbi:MAG TPA: hypothetical protein VHO70_00850 [Chitinispirillaceae bacterium]|nr:hypothetical protein [Chitinispirillaceae bacterium]